MRIHLYVLRIVTLCVLKIVLGYVYRFVSLLYSHAVKAKSTSKHTIRLLIFRSHKTVHFLENFICLYSKIHIFPICLICAFFFFVAFHIKSVSNIKIHQLFSRNFILSLNKKNRNLKWIMQSRKEEKNCINEEGKKYIEMGWIKWISCK